MLMNNNKDTNQRLLNELVVYTPRDNKQKIRVGKGSDGGYIIIDREIEQIEVFYSYGINDDYSFDEDLSEKLNLAGRLFDPTVTYPEQITKSLHFKKIGLATGEGTITDHVVMYGDLGKKMILKIDIEGAEWDWLAQTTQEELGMFDQILIEYHNLDKVENYSKYINGLSKINKNFYLCHVHGNNHRPVVKINKTYIPEVLECTYIRKDLCDCIVNNEVLFPVEGLDLPNHHWLPDINLNYWPFISKQSEDVERSAHEDARAFNKMHSVYHLMYQEIVRLNLK